jgi:hypothetical protein
MSRPRPSLAAVLLFTMALASEAGCRACGDSAASSQDAGADAAPADAAPPYLPARPLPDDSPAPLSVVESSLLTLRPQLNACYRAASEHNPALVAQATMAVTIGGDGHVTDVATVSQTGLDTAMLGCLTTTLRTATFPPPADGGPAVIKVPLSFRPPLRRPDAGADAAH